MMYNVEEFKKLYPEMFSETSPYDIITGVLILGLIFIIPYLYIRFLEEKVITFVGNSLVPFIQFRLRLKRLIDFIHHILEIQVFGRPGSRI